MNMHAYRRNPLAILLVTFFLLVPVLSSFDPVTPAVFFILGVLNLITAGSYSAVVRCSAARRTGISVHGSPRY